MSVKLTLSIDENTIEQAKRYAKERNLSLSFLIENYLRKMVSEYQENQPKASSIVDELSGIISLQHDYDYKEAFGNYISEKHQ